MEDGWNWFRAAPSIVFDQQGLAYSTTYDWSQAGKNFFV
jgi:hypothetical protein